MALIVRMVSAAGGKVVEKRLKTGLNKLVVPEGGHIEVVDQATGLEVHGVRSVDANGNSVLSFAGPKGEISLDIGSSAVGSLPLFSDASFAETASVDTAAGASGGNDDHSDGRVATPILLGILGLGALGGIAAAAGGGGAPKDTSAPAAPSGLDLATADDSGSSSTDNVTKNTSGLTITGTAEAGARVELFDGATSLGVATADASGNFSLDVTLSAGVHAITAKAGDAAGNVSSASSALSLTVDATAPTAAIAISDTALVAGETAQVTITFSEAVTDFSNADLTVQSGTLSNVATSDGGVTWTATFTPTAGVNDTSNVIALATSYSDVAGNAGSAASSANYSVNTVTFTVTETPAATPGGNPVVSLGGNAQGPVTITLNADDQAVFSRDGQTAPTVVSDISTKTLQVPTGGTINLVIDGAATTDVFTIDAPNAATLVLTGNGGAGSDTISVVVESASANPDLRVMTLNTSGLTGVEAIKFVFPTDARDVVKLTADSVLTGFSTIEVSKGGVDLTSVQVAPGTEFIVNSTLILTLDQFKQMTSLVSVTGLGKLTINLTAAEVQSGALESFLTDANAAKPILIGTAVTVVDTSNNATLAAPAALDSISFEGIPGLSAAIDDLQAQIDALDLAGSSATTQITSIASQVTALESALAALASDFSSRSLAQSTALANLQTAFAAANAALGARIDSLASALHTEIVSLQSQITANGTDITTLVARATSLSAALAALTTTVSGNNTAQTAALASARTALETAISDLATRLDADIADLQGQIDTNGTDIAALADRATALETALAALTTTVADNDAAQTAALAAARTALETAISDLAARLDADIADLQSQIDSNDTDIAALAVRATALETALAALTTTVADNDAAQTAALAAAKSALETSISDLAARLDADIADLQSQIDSNDTDIAALAVRATALETALAALTTTVADNDAAQTAALAAAKSALETSISDLAARLDADIADLQSQIDSNDTDIAALAVRATALETALAALTTTVADNDAAQTAALAAAKSALETSISDLATRLDADIADLQSQIDTNDTDIAALADRATALETAVTRLDGAVDVTGSVKAQIAAAKLALETSISDLATRLDADIADLQSQIDTINTDAAANGGIPSLSSIAGLKAAIETLNGLAALDGSVAHSIADAIGHESNPTADPAVAATGLFADIERLIGAASTALQHQIDLLKNDGSENVPATLESIAGLHAAIDALRDGTNLGDAENPNSLAGKLAGLQSQIDTLVNGLDTTHPTIVDVHLASATGYDIYHNLNVGDVVTATVKFSEVVVVTGAPTLALQIGDGDAAQTVQATLTGGAGTDTLTFSYTIQVDQSDQTGISLPTGAISLNGGSIKDVSANTAVLTHDAVTDNSAFTVDNGLLVIDVPVTAHMLFDGPWMLQNLNAVTDENQIWVADLYTYDGDLAADFPNGLDHLTQADLLRLMSNSTGAGAVFAGDLDGWDRYTVPQGMFALTEYAWNLQDQGDLGVLASDRAVPTGSVLVAGQTFDLSDAVLVNLFAENQGTYYALLSRAELADIEAINPTAAQVIDPGTDAALSQDTIQMLTMGRNAADIVMNVTTPLTVAQAASLAAAGFDLEHNISYSIRDSYATVQAAMADPNQAHALLDAQQVIALGDELSNAVAMTAMTQSVNLRTELGEGNDSYNASRANEQIVGQQGGDTINLTYKDGSTDAVVYQSIYDGRTDAIARVGFSSNSLDYRVGSVLTVSVNGADYSYTTQSNESPSQALYNLADVVMRGQIAGRVQIGYLYTLDRFGNIVGGVNGVFEDQMVNGSYTVPAGKFFLTVTDFLNISSQQSYSRNWSPTGMDIILMAYRGGQSFSLSNEKYYFLADGENFGNTVLAAEDSLYNYFTGYWDNTDVQAWNTIASAERHHDVANVLVDAQNSALTFVGTSTASTLSVHGGGDYAYPIDNDGELTVVDVTFTNDASRYPTTSNDGHTTIFDRELRVTIDGLTVTANVVAGEPVESVAALRAAIVAAMDSEATSAISAAKSIMEAEASLSRNNSISSYSGTVTVNGVAYAIAQGAVTIGGLMDQIARITGIHSVEIVDGSIVITEEVHGSDAAANTLSVSLTIDNETLWQSQVLASGHSLYSEISSVVQDGTTLTLAGRYVPATDASAPTFVVDNAEIDQSGVQQISVADFSSNDADYFAGGKLHVTIAGHEIVANMVAGSATQSLQNLVDAIDVAAHGTYYSEPTVTSFNLGGVTNPAITGTDLLQSWGYNSPITIDNVGWANLSYRPGLTLNDLITDFNAQFTGVAVMSLANGQLSISVADASLNNAAISGDIVVQVGGNVLRSPNPDMIVRGHDAGYFTGEGSGYISDVAAVVEGAARTGFSVAISANSEQPDPLHLTNVKQDYIGEQQQATATLDTVTHYSSYTYDLAGGVTPSRAADVYYQGGKAHLTITPVDAEGVEGTPVTVSADMVIDGASTRIHSIGQVGMDSSWYLSGDFPASNFGFTLLVGGVTYTATDFQNYLAALAEPKMIANMPTYFVGSPEATVGDFVAWLNSLWGVANVVVDNSGIQIMMDRDVTVEFTTLNWVISRPTGDGNAFSMAQVSSAPAGGNPEATAQALVDAVNAATHQTVSFVFIETPWLTLDTALNTLDGNAEKFKVAVTVNGTLPAGLDTEVMGSEVAGGDTIGSMIDYLNTQYAGLGTWSLNAAHNGLDFTTAGNAVVGFDASKTSLGEAVHIKLNDGFFADAQATTTAATLPTGMTAAIDPNAGTKIVVTAADYAKETFHVSATLDYQGVKQIATVTLDNSTTYGHDFVDGGTVDASGQAHVNRAANVYYDGGKAYLTITPVNPDGSDGTPVTVSADMVQQLAGTLIDYPPLFGNENGIWVGSWGTDLFDIAVQVGATTYTEADFATYLAGLSPAKTMVDNPLFDATGKATITDFVNWLDSLPNVAATVTQAGIMLTGDVAVTAFKTYFYDSPYSAGGPDMHNVLNVQGMDYAEATARALVAAINAAADGGALAGVIGSAELVNGTITLTSAVADDNAFRVSDVALDYQGIKQIATASLDTDTTYTTTYVDGATAGDATNRGAGVYYSGGKAYITITPVNADGTEGAPVTISADMADTNSIWFGFPQAPMALEANSRITPFTGALDTMTINVTVDGITHTRAEFETWLAALASPRFIKDPYHLDAETATASDLAAWIATLPGISSATFDGYGFKISPSAGHTVHMDAYLFGISSVDNPGYWVYAQYEISGAERAAADTAQALVDAINAQTGVGGSLHGVVGSAALVNGAITMTADHAGELTFKVSDVALDYQGLHQIATVDYSTNDADYYNNQTNGTGQVSIDIDTMPGVEGGVVHVVADMVEDDATASLQNLVTEIRHLANDVLDPATAAAATVAGTFASGNTNDGALATGFYVSSWSVTVGGIPYSGGGFATTQTIDNPLYDPFATPLMANPQQQPPMYIGGNINPAFYTWQPFVPNPSYGQPATIDVTSWNSTGEWQSQFANLGAFLTYLSGLAGVDTAYIDANGDIVVTTDATGAAAHVTVAVNALADASDPGSAAFVSANTSGSGSDAIYGALHGFVSDATLSNGTLTVVSQNATHEQFSLTDADITERPEYQQASAHFSNDNADYFAGGKIGLTINGETIEVNMVAGDAAATVQALADAVAAKNAQPAGLAQYVIDLPTDILATDSYNGGHVAVPGTRINTGEGPSGWDYTVGGMLQDLEALPGVQSAQLVNGNIVITADPGVQNLLVTINIGEGWAASGDWMLTQSALSGDLKDVSLNGTDITFTATNDVDGYGEINVTDVHTGIVAQNQITEVLLGDVAFENGTVGDNGTNTVRMSVAGESIVASTGVNDADTVRNLAQAIIEARDGVYDTTAQTSGTANTAAVVHIGLPTGTDGTSLLLNDGNGHDTRISVAIDFWQGSNFYTFQFDQSSALAETSVADFIMSLNEQLTAWEEDPLNNVPAGMRGTISYDAATNQIVVTSEGAGSDYGVGISYFTISQFWSHEAIYMLGTGGSYVPAALDFSTPTAVTSSNGGLRIDLVTTNFFDYMGPGSGNVTLNGLDNAWSYKPLLNTYQAGGRDYSNGYGTFALNLHFETGGASGDFSQTLYLGEDVTSIDANGDHVIDLRDYVQLMNDALTAWEGATGGLGEVATISMDGNGDIIVTPTAGVTVTMPQYGQGTTGAFVLTTYDNMYGRNYFQTSDSGLPLTLGEDGVIDTPGSTARVYIQLPNGVTGTDLIAAGTAVSVDVDFVSGVTPYHFTYTQSPTQATSIADFVTALNDALTAFETANESISLGTFSYNAVTRAIVLDATGATNSLDVNAFNVAGFLNDHLALTDNLSLDTTTGANPTVTLLPPTGNVTVPMGGHVDVDVTFSTGGNSYDFVTHYTLGEDTSVAAVLAGLNAQLTAFETSNGVEMGTFVYDGGTGAIKLTSDGSNTFTISINQFDITNQFGVAVAGSTGTKLESYDLYDQGETRLIIDGAVDLTAATRISADVLHFSFTVNGQTRDYTFTPPLKEAESDPGATVGDLMNFLSEQDGVHSVAIVDGNIVITPWEIEPGVPGSISGSLSFDTLGTPSSAATGWVAPTGGAEGGSVTLTEFAHLTGLETLVEGPIHYSFSVGDGEGVHTLSGTFNAGAGTSTMDLAAYLNAEALNDGGWMTFTFGENGITVTSTAHANGFGGYMTDVHAEALSFAYVLGQGYNVVQSVSDALGTVDYNAGNESITLIAQNNGPDPLNVSMFNYDVTDEANSLHQKIYVSLPNETLDNAADGTVVSVKILGIESHIVINTSGAPGVGEIDVRSVPFAQRSEFIVSKLIQQIRADHPADVLGNIVQGRLVYDNDGNADLAPATGLNANVIMFESNTFGINTLGRVDDEVAIHARVTYPNIQGGDPVTMFYSAATGQIQQGSLVFTNGMDSAIINDETSEGNAQTGRNQGVLSYDDGAAGAASATDYVFTIGETVQNPLSMSEFSNMLDINDEVRAGDSTDYINQDLWNPSDRSTYYGNSPITGIGEDGSLLGIDQNFANPTNGRTDGTATGGDATFAGDSALVGSGEDGAFLGIDQNYLNPGSGRGEDINGDATFYGDAAATGTSGVHQTVANTNGSYTAIDTSPAANTENVSTGTDALYGAAPGYYGDLGLYTDHVDNTQTVTGETYYPIDKIDMETWGFGTYANTFENGSSHVQDGFAAFTWDRSWTEQVSDANTTADTINNFQVDAMNNSQYSHDTIAIEGALAASTLVGPVEVSYGYNWQPWFDLDTTEFGIVSQWANRNAYDPVTSSKIDNADAVAQLLSETFWTVSWGEDSAINTSIFAVTASNDPTETAIWAHQQSTSWDSTIDANELKLLAIVHTTGGEFGASNFEVLGVNNGPI